MCLGVVAVVVCNLMGGFMCRRYTYLRAVGSEEPSQAVTLLAQLWTMYEALWCIVSSSRIGASSEEV